MFDHIISYLFNIENYVCDINSNINGYYIPIRSFHYFNVLYTIYVDIIHQFVLSGTEMF